MTHHFLIRNFSYLKSLINKRKSRYLYLLFLLLKNTWLENGLFVAFWVWFFATAIVFAIWWASFQFSWGNILDKVRWSLKIMAFWYWHYFLFASIAWIWISLELVADWAKNYYLNSWWEHSVTAFFAICVLCSFVGIYFLVNSLMRIILIQKNKYQIYTIFI